MSRNILAFAAIAALWASTAFSEAKITTVVDGLDNPCGVAIQPDTGHIFVSDSGAGRVIRIVDGKAQDVIVGFKTDIYGKGPMYNIGPLGLLFLNKDTLIVGGGDLVDGQELIRSFTIPAVGQPAIKVEQATSGLALPAQGELKGEGNFYALAVSGESVFATSNGDDTKGWVARATVKGGKLGAFERFLATKEAVQVDAPVGVTMSPRGELVIGQMGEINVPHDGLLTFYNAKDGKMLMNLATNLYDITALAYNPKGQQLLALDFAWMKADEGGLYSLVSTMNDGKQAIQAKKIVALDKPTAMAFASDGSLYATIFGTAAEGGKKSGSLVKIDLGN